MSAGVVAVHVRTQLAKSEWHTFDKSVKVVTRTQKCNTKVQHKSATQKCTKSATKVKQKTNECRVSATRH